MKIGMILKWIVEIQSETIESCDNNENSANY